MLLFLLLLPPSFKWRMLVTQCGGGLKQQKIEPAMPDWKPDALNHYATGCREIAIPWWTLLNTCEHLLLQKYSFRFKDIRLWTEKKWRSSYNIFVCRDKYSWFVAVRATRPSSTGRRLSLDILTNNSWALMNEIHVILSFWGIRYLIIYLILILLFNIQALWNRCGHWALALHIWSTRRLDQRPASQGQSDEISRLCLRNTCCTRLLATGYWPHLHYLCRTGLLFDLCT